MHYLPHQPLYTDYYQLMMARGYWIAGKADNPAVFNYFFRDFPFNGGYVIFAGLQNVLHTVKHYHFDSQSLAYLSSQNFEDAFLAYLSELKFSISVTSVPEGQVVFPNEPLVTVSGPLLQCQLLETMLLNQINYQSLIATKGARVKQAAGFRTVMDFGLRRAQGLGGIQASRAAYIGGVDATSNVWSAKEYDIPATGTMAHSWIQSFDSELESFRQYADDNPDSTILLVDTYDTLNSGVPNAIIVAKELEEKGNRLRAIRLDSGNPVELTQKARAALDESGLDYVKIALSDQLDEHVISGLIEAGASIDLLGVGTRLVTGHDTPALDGVYKMSEINGRPTSKRSDNQKKETLPGKKEILRFFDDQGNIKGDLVALEDEIQKVENRKLSPSDVLDDLPSYHNYHRITRPVCENGVVSDNEFTPVSELRDYAHNQLSKLPDDFKRLKNPKRFEVWNSRGIAEMKQNTKG